MALTQLFPLTLGSISFDAAFEGPNGWEEGLGDLGTEQLAVVKKYPGGDMSAQLMGPFPKEQKIKGYLFGSNAPSRSDQLEQLCKEGDLLTLAYMQKSYDGFVRDYVVHVKAPSHWEFTLIFTPLADNSSSSTSLNPVDPASSALSNALNTMGQQASAPANGSQLPSGIQQGAATLQNNVSQAVQQTGGSVASLPTSTVGALQGQISSLLSQLSPLVNGSDPVSASAAADLTVTLNALSSTIGQATTLSSVSISSINPDLYSLAAFYYGNPSQWESIANATNNANIPNQSSITDPFPSGTFTLVIPSSPVVANAA